MALKFAKKTAPGEQSNNKAAVNTGKSEASGATAASWMKKGNAAKEALAQEEAAAELRKQEAGRMFRFFCPEGEDRRITFLDGKLDSDGMLDVFMFYEHRLKVNGNWENFVCTAEADQSQPCPICEKGERASLVAVMTIIDHTPHTIKNGPKKGTIIQNTRKLFVCKRQTIQQLTKLAASRGGLAGCTFDVSRIGENSAGVGSQFDFQEKFTTRQDIMNKFDLKEEDVVPANYGEEIRFLSPQELIELGVGKAQSGIGYNSTGKGAKSNLSDEL